MSAGRCTTGPDIAEHGEDFAISRVPLTARFSWASLAMENLSLGGCISSVLLGATLGHRMPLTHALWSIAQGTALLASISCAVGHIGCREGLATVMICRWAGFGDSGAAIVSVIVTISLAGWFGIQSAVAGEGLSSLCGGLPP